MTTKRRKHSAEFKARVGLEAVKGQRTINEIAACYEVHPGQVLQWKKHLVEGLASLFDPKRDKADQQQQVLTAQLYQQIGQLKVEVDWLKKKSEQLRLR